MYKGVVDMSKKSIPVIYKIENKLNGKKIYRTNNSI